MLPSHPALAVAVRRPPTPEGQLVTCATKTYPPALPRVKSRTTRAAHPQAMPAETAVAEQACNQAGTHAIEAVADDGEGSASVPALVWGIGSALVLAAGVATAVILRRKRGVK
jgi:hypothetical protein